MGYQPKDTFFGKVLFGIDCVAFFLGFLMAFLLGIFLTCYAVGGVMDGLGVFVGYIVDVFRSRNIVSMTADIIFGVALLWLAIRWKFSREMLKTIKESFTKPK